MTQEPLDHIIPPFDGDLYSEAWWQRVAPNLTPEGRALVQKNLMDAADRLEGGWGQRQLESALEDLEEPTTAQLAFLRSPKDPIAKNQLLQDDQLDLSKILICHPETGQAIDWRKHEFPAVNFERAIFVGEADFAEAEFKGDADFSDTIFACDISFEGSRFEAYVTFEEACFAENTEFAETIFEGEANFYEALFIGNASFVCSQFNDYTNFEKVHFIDDISFGGAHFAGQTKFFRGRFDSEADFDQVHLEKDVDFICAQFADYANFYAVHFLDKADFRWANFARAASFKQTEFIDMAIFEETTFKGVANFHAARFSKTASFRRSNWEAVPDFVGTAFKDGMAIADLKNLQAGLTKGTIAWDADPEPTPPPGCLKPAPAPITDRLQALRKMAHDADDRPRELAYFALELQSRYQGAGLAERLKRQLIGLYGLFSDYGRGIGRPFGWLVGLWVGCALGYALLIKNAPPIALWLCLTVWALFIGATIDLWLFDRRQKSSPHPKNHWWVLWGACVGQWGWLLWSIPQYGNALLLSLVNALPALGVASEARKSSLDALYDADVPAIVHGIGIFEGVAAILLLFLIGLGLRNRFRL